MVEMMMPAVCVFLLIENNRFCEDTTCMCHVYMSWVSVTQ